MRRRVWQLAVLLGVLVGALTLSSLPVREVQAGWQITPTPTSGRRTLRIGVGPYAHSCAPKFARGLIAYCYAARNAAVAGGIGSPTYCYARTCCLG